MSCLGQMRPWVLQQMFCTHECMHPLAQKADSTLTYGWSLRDSPISARRSSKFWVRGKFSLFQARETSVLPKWMLIFRYALGYYKYNLSEVWVCQEETEMEWVCVCVCVCVCMMTERGASTGPEPRRINASIDQECKTRYTECPMIKFRIIYCFLHEEVEERELEWKKRWWGWERKREAETKMERNRRVEMEKKD